ncbi:hypothetical protein OF83DRAFT_838089 [Amylostereum chailletii]|nr:hypothetical protein OF83DRAFT_838089 [Amylostereum chailletii]
MALLAARSAHEKAVTTLQSAEEALEASRQHARETTEMLRLKAEEVEHLRVVKGTDDRERAVKIRELVGDVRLSRLLFGFFAHSGQFTGETGSLAFLRSLSTSLQTISNLVPCFSLEWAIPRHSMLLGRRFRA